MEIQKRLTSTEVKYGFIRIGSKFIEELPGDEFALLVGDERYTVRLDAYGRLLGLGRGFFVKYKLKEGDIIYLTKIGEREIRMDFKGEYEEELKAYLFICSYETINECFSRSLFGIGKKHWGAVQEISEGDILFLYNLSSRELIGPFIAASEGGWRIDPEAWSGKFPSQVRVKWDEKNLHVLKNADKRFQFLRDKDICKLTSQQAGDLLSALKEAHLYIPPKGPIIPPEVESEAEKQFAKLLDGLEIAYIRFSQTPADFSKVLKEMRAKRPDFLIFKEKPIFIEVKPNLISYKRELIIDLEEIERLKQLELTTGVEVLIVFPIDPRYLEWRGFKPSWIWAKGKRKIINDREVLIIPIEEVKERKLPFS